MTISCSQIRGAAAQLWSRTFGKNTNLTIPARLKEALGKLPSVQWSEDGREDEEPLSSSQVSSTHLLLKSKKKFLNVRDIPTFSAGGGHSTEEHLSREEAENTCEVRGSEEDHSGSTSAGG